AVKVANPLGEEFSELKNNPLVSALKVISLNQRVGNQDLSLFELSRTFLPINSNYSFIPNITEKEWLLVIMSGKSLSNNWISKGEKYDYYSAKSIYEEITSYFNLNTKKLINGNLYEGFGANSQSIWRN